MDTRNVLIWSICFLGLASEAFSETCAGCPVEQTEKDNYLPNLRTALKGVNRNFDVVQINKVFTQVVSGIYYKVNFSSRGSDGSLENCDASWVERLWETKEPLSLKVKCDKDSPQLTRSARKALLGASKDVDANEMGYIRELANAAVDKLDEVDVDNHKRFVIDVVDAKKQIVSGILYHIHFTMKTTSCDENAATNNGDKCELNEVEPRKLCKVSMHKSFSEDNPLTVKMVNSRCTDDTSGAIKKFGSPNDVSGDDEYIKAIAKFAADDINSKANGAYVKKVTKIIESSIKTVSGKMVTLVIELQETDCAKQNGVDLDKCNVQNDNGIKTECNVVVWDQPWLNSKKVVSESCKTRRKRSTIPGGSSQVDPQDKKIVALQDFIADELTARANSQYTKTIVKVFNATTQVVSGSLTRMTVEVADTNCLKGENKARSECQLNSESRQVCHVTIWEQAWLNKKEITQSECHAIQPTSAPADTKFNAVADDALIGPHVKHIKEFIEFTERHNKKYENLDEFLHRLRIFRANMAKINYLQKTEQGTGIYGPTMFADMTQSEFKAFLGLKQRRDNGSGYPYGTAVIPNITIPDEYDWRNYNAVTSVKNQGACGSCWAFSVAGNIEGQNAIKNKKLVSLSEQELVDCDKYDHGCGGGDFDTAYHAVEDLGGLETEEEYPYHGRQESCHMDESEPRVAIRGALNVSQDETEIAKYLVAHGPLSVGINANAMQFYMGGVSHPLRFLCSPNSLDHGVLLVGYGTHRTRFTHKLLPYWLIKNSWGTGWGQEGYYMVYRGDGTCGVNKMVTSSIL